MCLSGSARDGVPCEKARLRLTEVSLVGELSDMGDCILSKCLPMLMLICCLISSGVLPCGMRCKGGKYLMGFSGKFTGMAHES